MKKTILYLLLAITLLSLTGCAKKALHCDNCNAEVQVKESSEMDESWIIYCENCNKELFGDD